MRIFLLVLSFIFVNTASAADIKEYKISIRDHRFVPAEISIPANTKVKLIVQNEDASVEEFESHELNREKIVAGKSKITVFIGPLKPGRYPFFGEFHIDTAQGVVIVK
jgi:plastocyanin